jgi:serine/threonine protein phosphatase PrpC
MSRTLHIEAVADSHVGCVRVRNEDSFASLPELGLFMVADGLGGRPAGDVASRMVVEIVCKCFEHIDPDDTWPYGLSGRSGERDEARLVLSIQKANREIFERSRNVLAGRGMGTTFAGVLVSGENAILAHVGDSRVYRFRGGELEQLTRDHSVSEMVRQHGFTLDAFDGAPPGAIVRAVGTDSTVEVETACTGIEGGDLFLLCSDGLWGPVPEDEIAATLASTSRPEVMLAGLIERAHEHGGPDNVTCVLVRFGEPRREASDVPSW